ncbi:hypothetical protein EU527_16940 [Candidatus Thorarchaeota archaeon]|nr:MAG: hypothetical protein EU527_16940 [Candidatus Thorarchaeota archaeon]
MMQSLIGYAIVAAVYALFILLLVVLLGIGVGYRDEIVRQRLDLYAKTAFVLVSIVISLYLFVSGIFGFTDLLIIGVLTILLVICTDWSRLGKDQRA